MSFADFYLQKYSTNQAIINSEVDDDLKIVVIIPCFDEPDLIRTLNSLKNCQKINSKVEVIIHINSGLNTISEIKKTNFKTFELAKNWILNYSTNDLKFHLIFTDNLPDKDAGVGLARKIAMDEAVRRFNSINNEKGIIVSFDADSQVDENYFVEIEKAFSDNKTLGGAIYFEHPIEGEDFDQFIFDRIIQYELYLRYYYQALKYIEFPQVIHTVGSSFAVRADAYCKIGGMNKKKAGEDFYFLQKLLPLGQIKEINTTKVIPSPRPSDRVPFGTGAAIMKWNENEANYLTYNIQSFLELKKFIEIVPQFYKITETEYYSILKTFHIGIQEFLQQDNFFIDLKNINENSSNLASFVKRFYGFFNMFKVLKCLNYLATEHFKHIAVSISAQKLLLIKNISHNENLNSKELLEVYRGMEFKVK